MATERISPTAHYTGYVWERNGLCHPALRGVVTPWLYRSVQPMMRLASPLVGLTLEDLLLQRHRIIDALLTRAIDGHGIRQVVEIACGYASRGLRFAERLPDIAYIEADLPSTAEGKRAHLRARGVNLNNHHVVAVDALRDEGLDAARALLDEDQPTAVITEGLVNYFPPQTGREMWRRFSQLAGPGGVYLAEVYPDDVRSGSVLQRAFVMGLSMFARGQVWQYNVKPPDLERAGFSRAKLHLPASWTELGIPRGRRGDLIQILEAWNAPG